MTYLAEFLLGVVFILLPITVWVFIAYHSGRLQYRHIQHLIFMTFFFLMVGGSHLVRAFHLRTWETEIEWLSVLSGILWLGFLVIFLVDQWYQPTKTEYAKEQVEVENRIARLLEKDEGDV